MESMRLMKILLTVILAAMAAVAQPGAAARRDFGGGRFEVQADRQRPDRIQRQPPEDFRRAERPPEREKRGDGRLTEEERRELRRDIDRANREIYKGKQQ